MRNKFLIGALIATGLTISAENNPVLMTINGEDVRLSEFEYMYHKNNKQQLEKESLDKYVDRFVVYKLKVAEAKAEGLDTLASFVTEYNGYKRELMRPYLENNTHALPYAKEAYERMKKNMEIQHITMYPGAENKVKMDSIYNCLKNGEDFETLAAKYSIAKAATINLSVGQAPYPVENAAYTTPIGEFSNVVESQNGLHIVKVLGEHATKGTYQIAYILKSYPHNSDENVKDSINAKADSIYNALQSGADFAKLAKLESDDKRTGNAGGELGWYGIDQLIPVFNDAMLNTPVGAVAEPVKNDYGIFIIKVLAHKPLASYAELEKQLLSQVNRDERAQIIESKKINTLKQEYNYQLHSNFERDVKSMLAKNGYDSTFVADFEKSNMNVFTYKGGTVKASALMKHLSKRLVLDAERGYGYINNAIESVAKKTLFTYEKEDLVNKYPEYANLLTEYRDGILMFEINNRNVWEKATKDQEGLEKYFTKNRKKYSTWTSPKFKGLIVYSVNDSVENAVKEYAKTLGGDTLATSLHKKFRKKIRIEKHLTSKEDNNAVVNELVFNGEKAPRDPKYPTFFMLEGKVINQPEEAADVKGVVTADYQQQLEKEWVKKLKSKHKVKINKNVLKLVKE